MICYYFVLILFEAFVYQSIWLCIWQQKFMYSQICMSVYFNHFLISAIKWNAHLVVIFIFHLHELEKECSFLKHDDIIMFHLTMMFFLVQKGLDYWQGYNIWHKSLVPNSCSSIFSLSLPSASWFCNLQFCDTLSTQSFSANENYWAWIWCIWKTVE